MHDYSIFGHDRSSIGRWLGFLAILISGGLANVFSHFSFFNGLIPGFVSVGLLYIILSYFFNKYIWKKFDFSIPDMNGKWDVFGKTLDGDGNIIHEWGGGISIRQEWKNICIAFESSKSKSCSYTASVFRKIGIQEGWVVSYSYRSEPNLENIHSMSSHRGYCEIEFNNDFSIGKATYFNSHGRNTYGIMELKRI